jgi:hypothetical protein
MRDDDLRAQLADWVRPVVGRPAPDVQAVRRRARRHGLRRAALAVGATAVVIAVVAAVVLASPRGPGRPAAGPTVGSLGGSAAWSAAPGTWYPGVWRPAGALPAADAGPDVAPYFVAIGTGGSASVTDAFTGRVTGTALAPGRGAVFTGVAAAGDDRTFVLAARVSGAVGFYELRLRSDGRVSSLSRLFTLPVRAVPTFAVSPDARLLAYTTRTGIETVSLATRMGRSWTAVGAQAYGLSWAGDSTVAFEWNTPASAAPDSPLPAGAGVRLLDIAAAGPLIKASRLLIASCPSKTVCVGGPLITPDGSKVFVTSIALGRAITTAVEEYSARTGRELATVTPPVTTSGGTHVCTVLWTDPSGQQLAAVCGQVGVIDGTRFSKTDLHLPTDASLASGGSFAW